jgi:hypothetical protein
MFPDLFSAGIFMNAKIPSPLRLVDLQGRGNYIWFLPLDGGGMGEGEI